MIPANFFKEDEMKKTLFFVFLITAILGMLLFFVNRHHEKAPLVPAAKLTVTLERGKLISLLKENGLQDDVYTVLASKLLPEEISLSCMMNFNSENGMKLSMSELSVNGKKIPDSVLRNISENYLDFKCSLVYN